MQKDVSYTRPSTEFNTTIKSIRDSNPLLSRDEETALALQMKNGSDAEKSEARNRLLLANTGLMLKSAHKFNTIDSSLEDKFQDSVVAVLENIDKYNGSTKFPTYMHFHIDNALRNGMALSVHDMGVASKIAKARASFIAENHRSPDDEELADEMGVSLKYLRKKLSEIDAANTSVSLSEPLEPGETSDNLTLADLLEDTSNNPEEQFFLEEKKRAVRRAIRLLPARERNVLCYLLGFYGNRTDDKAWTTRTVAEKLGMNRQTVNNVYHRALNLVKDTLLSWDYDELAA